MTNTFDVRIQTESQLRMIYKAPTPIAVGKEIARLDRHCRDFIKMSPFICLSSMGPSGADISPRGGAPGFVAVLDDSHIAIPDRPGNNRIDSLMNILHQPAVGLIFFVPGFEDVLRVNGVACIHTDKRLMEQFVAEEKLPLSVLVVTVDQAQMHCAKAVRRADLWNASSQRDRKKFPSLGQILHDQLALEQDATSFNDALEVRNQTTLY